MLFLLFSELYLDTAPDRKIKGYILQQQNIFPEQT